MGDCLRLVPINGAASPKLSTAAVKGIFKTETAYQTGNSQLQLRFQLVSVYRHVLD